MTQRERLIELLKNEQSNYSEDIADYLLANGIIAFPCKVGDTVYRISRKDSIGRYIEKTTVSRIAIDNVGIWIFCSCNPVSRCVFGKTIFLTGKAAEKALEEREDNDRKDV